MTARVLRIDGMFLLVAGVGGMLADAAGYWLGAGPFAALAGNPLTLGVLEAHGLAALIGVLMLTAKERPRRWHAAGAGVHLLLGSGNLLFWDVYALMGITTTGMIATAAHAVLFVAQLACLRKRG